MASGLRSAAKTSLLSVLWSYDQLVNRSRNLRVAVLSYHDIENQGRSHFTVTPGDFALQIRRIHEWGFSFLGGDEFQNVMTGPPEAQGATRVLITFDDGYQSFETHAAPILREVGAPAIIFVHTDRGTRQIGAEQPLLDWDAIGRARSAGFEIGNHSHSHRSFHKLSNDEIGEELDRSGAILREKTGIVPRFFAYPGGGYEDRMEDQLAGHGYSFAFGGRQRRAAPSSNPFNVERICVRRETSPRQLYFALGGALDRYDTLRHGRKIQRRGSVRLS